MKRFHPLDKKNTTKLDSARTLVMSVEKMVGNCSALYPDYRKAPAELSTTNGFASILSRPHPVCDKLKKMKAISIEKRVTALELEYLRTFLLVARYGSISQAAKQLFLSQTSVSNRIKELEKELGAALFIRTGRNLQLTAEGQEYVQYAERSLTLWDEGKEQLSLSRDKGTVTLAAMSNFCTYILPDWLTIFRKRCAEIEIRVRTGHSRPIIDQVLRGTTDIGLVRGPVEHTGLLAFPILQERIIPVISCGHSWCERSSVSPGEFAGQPIIAYNRFSSIWAKLEQWFARHGVNFSILMDLDHVEAAKLMTLHGHGIAFLPFYTVSEELENGTLGTVELNPPLHIYSKTNLIYNRRFPPAPHVKQLADFLLEQASVQEVNPR